ncbi:nitrilase-related carbon-nitrogen hydrolase [Palleronia abyssalis]|uniref:Glutamine-dependent NAD(+) synthetase n=1 Tax=Palleronia abyssalis TaxID=1501240 RepID=A0A2R8BUM0_9RHOB|nr:nitrilase-related carbon-nitrogen hydrolase [Palleronia abyssalis]SPJ23840.1 Glutamine-dependent NAD(+) synthetase [Palleronia abyssalis]
MTDRFRATLAQLGPAPGDLAGNAAQAMTAWTAAREAGSDMLALPELFLTGPDLGDLVRDQAFMDAVHDTVADLAQRTSQGPALLIGAPCRARGTLHAAYWVCQGGAITARVLKHTVAKDGAYDHAGLFDAAPIPGPVSVGPVRIGVLLGEDAHAPDVAEAQAESGAEILLAPTAAPFHRGGHDRRLTHAVARVVETGLPLIHLNGLGGDGRTTCDGTSFILNRGGALAHQMGFCDPGLRHVDFARDGAGWTASTGDRPPLPPQVEQEYRILVDALTHRCHVTGAGTAIVDPTGGTDSALTAIIAVDALGPDNVHCVMMGEGGPTRPSRDAARDLAHDLGARIDQIALDAVAGALAEALHPLLRDHEDRTAFPARLRDLALAALAETTGALPLVAVNKTDMALGAMPHGANPGRYNPVGDVFSSRVEQLCQWRVGTHRNWMRAPANITIPSGVFRASGPPSTEGLPPDVLDEILGHLIERDADLADLAARGHDPDTLVRITRLLHKVEAGTAGFPPGPRLSSRALGDRRYPAGQAWLAES